MALFRVLFCTLLAIASEGLQFLASSKVLEIGLTKNLQIECTAANDSTIVLTTQIRILFSNNTVQPVFLQLGFVDSVFGIDNSSGAVDSGEIVGNGTSKLRLTWNYPNQDRAGVYRCEERGINIHGVQKTRLLTVEVSAVVPDQVTILNYIQKMSRDLDDLKAASSKEELILERGRSKFFRVSDAFQGRRYYLSSDSNVLVTRDAEAMCEIFGGYLVEIDSAEEYQFLVTFISNFPQYQLVLTGGSDEVMENNWINTYSQTPVKYINWFPGQPDGGRNGNCLYFYNGFGLKMDDFTCYNGVTNYVAGYLCEIEE